MKLNIVDQNSKKENEEGVFSFNTNPDNESIVDPIDRYNGTYEKSMGGTEYMYRTLIEKLDKKYTDKFQIICSRFRSFDENKTPIMWFHDTFNDPETQFLANANIREKFAKFIFVSNYQFTTFNITHGISYDNSVILKNAINPIITTPKPDLKKQINLIYHTTPHRGLEILVPVFIELCKHFDNIHLDVFSSFKIYGWEQRDTDYKKLLDICREHAKITYHGYQPNSVVRDALNKAHIFAFPSIWPETSCIAALEAMSAGCVVVASDYAALPETLGPYGYIYRYTEDPQKHANRFASYLATIISNIENPGIQENLDHQKKFIDGMYNWDARIEEWNGLFEQIIREQSR